MKKKTWWQIALSICLMFLLVACYTNKEEAIEKVTVFVIDTAITKSGWYSHDWFKKDSIKIGKINCIVFYDKYDLQYYSFHKIEDNCSRCSCGQMKLSN